jgi:hypothetical protein
VVIQEKTKQSPSAEFPDSATVLAQLDRILATPLFQHSKRYPALLRHVVEQTLLGAGDELKERVLGIAVFGRPPDYDTSADPVVRNTASEVRKRLDEYYSESGHETELRISLPPGAYVAEFHDATGDGAETSGVRRLDLFKRARWLQLTIGLSLLAACVFGAIRFSPRKSPVELFWAPIFQAPDPALVVTDTLVTLRDQPQPDSSDGSRQVRDIIDPKTYVNVIQESAKLASFLRANGKHLDYQLARNVTLATLRTRPFILRGAFNNQWTQRAVAPFRFYLQLDQEPLVRRIVDRQNPGRRDWAAPMTAGLKEDFALIARAVEPETGQMMIVFAGLSEKGSAAALEFVTNPKYLDRFATGAPRGWERRNIEMVIKSNLVNDEWGEPHIVAEHFW